MTRLAVWLALAFAVGIAVGALEHRGLRAGQGAVKVTEPLKTELVRSPGKEGSLFHAEIGIGKDVGQTLTDLTMCDSVPCLGLSTLVPVRPYRSPSLLSLTAGSDEERTMQRTRRDQSSASPAMPAPRVSSRFLTRPQLLTRGSSLPVGRALPPRISAHAQEPPLATSTSPC